VNAIVPYEVAGQAAATVQLVDVGVSAVWSIPVGPAEPGIFTDNSIGAGQAAVLNQDNSVNGPNQPAGRGSVIQIWATGIPVQGAVDGSIAPGPVFNATPPVSVLIGGVSAIVQYAGPAPGEVAGMVQVNAIVPENAPTGSAVPIILEAAGQQSQTTATIAVQ
jgi:trimeric autotransporter adhesin